MIRDRDMKDVLRVLETFDEQSPREYVSKHHLEELFKGKFDESNLKRIVRQIKEKKYMECIEYADFTDYRIRITPSGHNFLQGKDEGKPRKEPFRKKLLWIIMGVVIYGVAHYIVVRLTQK